MRALRVVDITDRQIFHDVLALALPKTRLDKQRFEEVFRVFFENDNRRDAVLEELVFHSAAEDADLGELARLLEQGRAAVETAVEAAAEAVGVDDIRYFTQRPVYRRRMLELLGIEALQQDVRRAQQRGDGALADWLQQAGDALAVEVEQLVEQRFVLFGDIGGEQLRRDMFKRLNLARIDRYYMQSLREQIERMARKLVTRHTQRRRKVSRRAARCAPNTATEHGQRR